MNKEDWYGLYSFSNDVTTGIQQRDSLIKELQTQVEALKKQLEVK